MEYYAHKDQVLPKHLLAVANEAKRFGRFFGGAGQAYLAGLLHDLGKAEDAMRKRILTDNKQGEKQPHAHHGAALALEKQVWPVAFAINGHHAGLHDRPDLQRARKHLQKARDAEKRLNNSEHWPAQTWPVADFGKNLPDWLENLPFATPDERVAKLRAVDLYTRFLFSALVDADRLDTEKNAPETRDNFAKRHGWRFGENGLAAKVPVKEAPKEAPDELLGLLNDAIKERKAAAQAKGGSPDVIQVRQEVLTACVEKASKPRGVFTLTVPTGGGKTLASVFFALKHIAHHNATLPENDPRRLRRIIVVIPFLNIIQQTAQELRKVFGDLIWKKDAADPVTGKKIKHTETGEEGAWVENDDPAHEPLVLEHHSQAQDPDLPSGKKAENGDADDYSRERTLRQLAAENWDAPIIVTTTVQFFDSLFSRRPADARKLHNIAQSVIIFDEVQTFPPRLMQPILDVLKELTSPNRPYGCSLVLCTATQPSLLKSDDLPVGFENVTPIISDPKPMFDRLKRTRYPELENQREIPRKSWSDLASEILQAPNKQGLVVVNTRRHARELFAKLRETDGCRDAVFHLSTWMTPAHRVEVLDEVRRRLDSGQPCFLVSTQCIEAGVDVDFPALWRALGPYDAIVQAAGRCNRNGRLKRDEAQVHVFRPENDALPPGVYQTATSQTELLRKMAAANPHDPGSFETYFRLLYQLSVPDECEIQREREELHFEQVHERFNFIESFSVPIIVAEYQLGQSRIALREMCEKAARKGFMTPAEWRQVQPHIVQLDYRDKKTARFNAEATVKMFRDDNELTGLRRLTNFSAYHGGLHGCGLDVDQVDSFETIL